MSITKRLTKIETSLTPSQAVLLWLKVVHPKGIDAFLAELRSGREDPLRRIPEMAAEAVRAAVDRKVMTPESTKGAEFEARKQAAFLVMLVINALTAALSSCISCGWARGAELLDRIRLQSQEVDPPQLVEKLAWLCEIVAKINSYLGDDSLVDELHRALLRRETIAEISKKYYDGQSILFPETENRLNQVIQQLQSMLLADKEPQQQSSLGG